METVRPRRGVSPVVVTRLVPMCSWVKAWRPAGSEQARARSFSLTVLSV